VRRPESWRARPPSAELQRERAGSGQRAPHGEPDIFTCDRGSAPPKATVTGVPDTSTAAQQISFGVSLASGYAFPLKAPPRFPSSRTRVRRPTINHPVRDRRRTASFTIPANATQSRKSRCKPQRLGRHYVELRTPGGGVTWTRAVWAIPSRSRAPRRPSRTSTSPERQVIHDPGARFVDAARMTEVNLHFTQAPGRICKLPISPRA